MKFRILYAFLVVVNLACSQNSSGTIPITDISEEKLEGAVLLDVRTPQEFNAGHLQGALNMDWLSGEFDTLVKPLKKNETIYVYCKMGGRSAKAQARLKELGFTKVVNLEGGYDAWSAKNK